MPSTFLRLLFMLLFAGLPVHVRSAEPIPLGSRRELFVDDALTERMSANPGQFPIVFRNVRRALLPQFPYSLFFVVEGNTLLVIACFHASRDPSQWKKRA